MTLPLATSLRRRHPSLCCTWALPKLLLLVIEHQLLLPPGHIPDHRPCLCLARKADGIPSHGLATARFKAHYVFSKYFVLEPSAYLATTPGLQTSLQRRSVHSLMFYGQETSSPGRLSLIPKLLNCLHSRVFVCFCFVLFLSSSYCWQPEEPPTPSRPAQWETPFQYSWLPSPAQRIPARLWWEPLGILSALCPSTFWAPNGIRAHPGEGQVLG